MDAYWGGSPRQRQGLGIADSRTFHDRIDAVGRDIPECLDSSVWPANLDGLHFCSRAQSKMQTEIVLRKIARAAAHFAELLDASRTDGHPSADCGAIALGANQAEQH